MLIKDYKNFYMNDTESIHDMLTRFKDIVNKTRGLGKKFDKEELIPKVLRLLTSMWESTITVSYSLTINLRLLDNPIENLIMHETWLNEHKKCQE